MTTRRPVFALRPFLAEDAPRLSEIFRAAITELTADDYEEGQREAWAAVADDENAFAERLAAQLTLVAVLEGEPIGFVSLADGREIDLLYVDPDLARLGVATTLVDGVERLGRARGRTTLTVDASDTARPFFERRGYVAEQRNSISTNGEWLANTTMTKHLVPEKRP